ncbi:MAG TPA: hypothetical protein PL188_02565 [Candidatus Cloacimonadota bacterium]|jgi:hypothetical protein|nr:hypothetical protein [Candidatus Cloacimonadota bacterium]
MSNQISKVLAKELATKINRMVNIPLIREEDEQIFFELIVSILLELFLDSLDVDKS